MTSLTLMYVYFDDDGEIKAISPMPDVAHKDYFRSATFPLSEVEGFLTAQKNPFDYNIKEILRSGSRSYKIIKKVTVINLTRTLDNYLTKIDILKNDIPTINVNINLVDKNVSVRLDPHFIGYANGTEEEQEDAEAFNKQGLSTLYVTKKNDPYHHLFTIVFNPKELFQKERLYFDYDETLDFSDVSIYTKKIVKSYGLSIRGK